MSTRVRGSLVFLLYYMAAGSVLPYLNLYYQSRGLDTEHIGVLAALYPVTLLIAGPSWSAIADGLRLHRYLLPATMLGTVIPALLLTQGKSFVTLVFLISLFGLLIAPIIPLIDNSIMSMLGTERKTYGRLRIWGAVGFGIAARASGEIVDHFGEYSIFVSFCVAMVLCAVVTLKMPMPRATSTVPFFRSLRQLVANRKWQGFLASLLLVGICMGVLSNFFVIYLKELGANARLYGTTVAVSNLSELPIFLLAPLFLKKYDTRGLLMIAFATYGVRGFAISFITDPHWAIAVQLLHGLSFSAMWTAGVTYAAEIAPEGLGASAQSAMGAMSMGIASATGALIGGRLYNAIGPVALFRVAGSIAFIGLVFFALTQYRARITLWLQQNRRTA